MLQPHQSPPSGHRKGGHGKRVAEIKHRVRTRKACEPCRSRRRKCNGCLPCSQCLRYSYDCEYAGSRRVGVPNVQMSKSGDQEPSYNLFDTAVRPGQEPYSESQNSPELTENLPEAPEPGGIAYPNQSDGHTHSTSPTRFRPTVDTVKGRFSNADSSILLPRKVGQSMELATHIRFHSYGWNMNTRLEPTTSLAPAICRYVTFQTLSFYSRVFFDTVDPIYHFIDQKKLLKQCAQYWTTEREEAEELEALVAGIVALGSFFSDSPHSMESQLVEHAKQVLDVGCAYAPGRMSLTQTAGWVLRTLYLRLTSRPHLSWYASSATMHTVEAVGLHMDLRNVEIVTKESTSLVSECISSRSDLLECAVFLNAIISAEYGRSRVILQHATEPDLESSSTLTRLTAILLRLDTKQLPDTRLKMLWSLQALPDEPSIFALLKTDVANHLFRKHLHPLQEKISQQESDILLSTIKNSLSQVRQLVPQRAPWWNILSTPFQSLMMLLAIDSENSLEMVKDTISVLDVVRTTFPTYLCEEVLQTAQTLVRGMEQRKLRQAKLLTRVFETDPATVGMPDSFDASAGLNETSIQAESLFENWLTGDMSSNWFPAGNGFTGSSDPNMDSFILS